MEAGFGADEFLAILKKGTKDGVFQLDFLADGVKELGINLQEVGKAQEEALTGIGLSAQEVTDAVNKGGTEAKEATLKVVDSLSKVEDKTLQNQYAVALFGTKWEDVGSTLLTALGDYGSELVNVDGSMKEMADNTEESVKGKMLASWNEFKTTLEPFGEKVIIPLMDIVGELVEKFTKWFDGLSDSEQKWIVWGAIAMGALSPLLGMASTLIGLFGGVTGAIGGAITKMGGMSGTFSGLAGLMSNPVVLVGALLAFMAVVGESETTILKLQEKFGGLGTVVAGVCEFISGAWQVTVGGMVNWILLACDLIAAVLDGAGGQTIDDAWTRFNARQELSYEEGMSKLALSTTRGMSKLRYLQDTELTLMNQSLDLAMQQVPLIMDEKYEEASTNLADSLATMNGNQLLALTNMNDTTRYMFSGIKEGMSIDEIVPILTTNFEQIKDSGRLNTEEMSTAISSAMETVKSQMDVKTSEGATAVETNMANANNILDGKLLEMQSGATSGMANVAGAMIDESGKIPDEVQNNMQTSAMTIQTTLGEMAKNVEKSINDLTYNATTYLQRIIDKSSDLGSAFYSAQSSIYNFAQSSMDYVDTMASNVIYDWNRVIDSLNRSVTGSVTINRTIRTNEAKALVTPLDNAMTNMQSLTRDMVIGGRMYQPNTIASSSSVKAENANSRMIDELRSQNNLLTQMLGVLMSERTIQVENSINLDGRSIAKGTAKYMEKEISTINKRNSRLGGVF